jgi:glycosyltransferase involved in cell wall biosynthesis
MKIAFLAVTLGREAKGGELYIHQLANALTQRGHSILVLHSGPALPQTLYQSKQIPVPFSLQARGRLPLSLSLKHLRSQRQHQENELWHRAFLAAALPTLVTFRPDILLPLFMKPELAFARMLRRLLGCRVVSVGHGGAGNDALAVGGVDAFVATSPRQAQWAEYFEQASVSCIPIGVDTARFTPTGPVASLSLPRPIFLQVGSLLPVKRAHLTIAAAAQHATTSVLILGDGRLAEETDREALQQLGAARYQRIAVLPHHQLPAYYRAADVLCFPSARGETAGLVMLEALACGIPVVASDDETRRWLVGEAAVLTTPEDPAVFLSSALHAMENSSRERCRAHATRFSWEAIAAEHEKLYLQLVRKS